jgi:hypothetical protein
MSLEGMFNSFVGGLCFGSGLIVAATILKAVAGWGFC